MPTRVIPKPDPGAARTIRWSRVISYVLVVLAAAVLSLRPELFGDPSSQPAHALLHVWRIVVGLLLAVAALGVQVAVGIRWRKGLRRAAADDWTTPGNRAPSDR
ncbi:hypothetical protein DEJ17_02180 [Curtobacterium sp. MCSS17_011]|uniref:hypothetical protein n=1 Tax=Curtobacterium sp. MCSS17_011 TaxID=2175643 RepID=UPI000D93C7FC|nr:hypothetical protein [Curtobacterium sp. MCSS17_011]PYY62650.1 hypothetical protein DEJ17_02180 [Curtobacterium sp. MCSS17_011]